MAKNSNLSYQQWLDFYREEERDIFQQIQMDIDRTFVGVLEINQGWILERREAALRRILCLYAVVNPEIGYCQGLNNVVAVFLQVMEEEKAFWTLKGVLEDRLVGYYSTGMEGLLVFSFFCADFF